MGLLQIVLSVFTGYLVYYDTKLVGLALVTTIIVLLLTFVIVVLVEISGKIRN